jgi:hypothetical protein
VAEEGNGWHWGPTWLWLLAGGVGLTCVAYFLWLRRRANEDERKREEANHRLEAYLRGLIVRWDEMKLEAEELQKRLRKESERVRRTVVDHPAAHRSAVEWFTEGGT